jgi:aldehyde dehydrogenase (NAD+)
VAGTTTVRMEAVGVVAAIPPSNFPQSLAATKYAPALAAGCTVILKPSPSTLLDAFHLMDAAAEAGLPPGVLNLLPASADSAAYLVGHPEIDAVAFTGSTTVGQHIAEICAPLLRPLTLELGGKSAAIVLDDADLDLSTTGERLFQATLLNNGQTCFLSTRILAPRSRYEQVVGVFAELASSLRVGNALDADTQVGPVISQAQRRRVESYIAQAKADGARLIVGGGRPPGLDKGWFVEPTVFADVDNRSRVAQEEIFGPVLCVTPYDDEDEAVRIANDSPYGLAGTVWSASPERAHAMARRIRTGSVGINGYLPDPGARSAASSAAVSAGSSAPRPWPGIRSRSPSSTEKNQGAAAPHSGCGASPLPSDAPQPVPPRQHSVGLRCPRPSRAGPAKQRPAAAAHPMDRLRCPGGHLLGILT